MVGCGLWRYVDAGFADHDGKLQLKVQMFGVSWPADRLLVSDEGHPVALVVDRPLIPDGRNGELPACQLLCLREAVEEVLFEHQTVPVSDGAEFHAASSTMATARVNPADARLILTGKHEISKPVDGRVSRFESFSM